MGRCGRSFSSFLRSRFIFTWLKITVLVNMNTTDQHSTDDVLMGVIVACISHLQFRIVVKRQMKIKVGKSEVLVVLCIWEIKKKE